MEGDTGHINLEPHCGRPDPIHVERTQSQGASPGTPWGNLTQAAFSRCHLRYSGKRKN